MYDETGEHRSDNIPLTALLNFRQHYSDDSITRKEVFCYVYALLHHPEYRTRYGENLRREFPRIPLVAEIADFRSFASAGKRLVDLHVNYDKQSEYALGRVENREAVLDWRVESMRLSADRRAIEYNEFLTLEGIPQNVFDYRLGNRSALEWVIDQYRVGRDEDGDIVSDPNRGDDEQYIVRLVGRVITVSLETLKIVGSLPDIGARDGGEE